MAKQRGDANMIVTNADDDGLVWYDPADSSMALTGFPWHRQNRNYCRLPMRAMPELREQLQWVAWQPSGGMVRLRSDSARIAIDVSFDRREHFMHNNTHGQESGFDCYLGAGSRSRFHVCLAPTTVAKQQRYCKALPAGMQDISLYFPLLNPITKLRIGLDAGAELQAPKAHKRGRIAFYGSSITQGFCCSRPGLTYPAQVCRALDAELLNLGFGGNAKGDLAVADAIADLDLDALVYDYDHNAPSLAWLKETHEPFFRRIRDRRPDLPILIVSSFNYWADEAFFGERAAIIERTYTKARKRDDRLVRFLHGKKLLPKQLWADGTVDRLHPNDLGFHLMAQGITAELVKLLD